MSKKFNLKKELMIKKDICINRFLRWYLTKTNRVCENCDLYDAENNKCKIFNCCWFPTDFCIRWMKKENEV